MGGIERTSRHNEPAGRALRKFRNGRLDRVGIMQIDGLDGLADTMLRQPPAKVFDDLECVRSAGGLAPPFDQCDGVIPGAFIISIGVTPEPRGGFLPYRLRPIHPPHSFNLELAVDLGEVN